jgi:hypothetical protein
LVTDARNRTFFADAWEVLPVALSKAPRHRRLEATRDGRTVAALPAVLGLTTTGTHPAAVLAAVAPLDETFNATQLGATENYVITGATGAMPEPYPAAAMAPKAATAATPLSAALSCPSRPPTVAVLGPVAALCSTGLCCTAISCRYFDEKQVHYPWSSMLLTGAGTGAGLDNPGNSVPLHQLLATAAPNGRPVPAPTI